MLGQFRPLLSRLLCASAAVLPIGIGPATALEIIQTNDVLSPPADIQTFNPSLGTLNSVTESFTGSFSVPVLGQCFAILLNGQVRPGTSCSITFTVSVTSSFGSDFSNDIVSTVYPTGIAPIDIPGGSATITGSNTL